MHYPAQVQIILEDTIERLREAGVDERLLATLSELLAGGQMEDIERIESVLEAITLEEPS